LIDFRIRFQIMLPIDPMSVHAQTLHNQYLYDSNGFVGLRQFGIDNAIFNEKTNHRQFFNKFVVQYFLENLIR